MKYLVFEMSQVNENDALYDPADKQQATIAEVNERPDAPGLVDDALVGGVQVAVLE